MCVLRSSEAVKVSKVTSSTELRSPHPKPRTPENVSEVVDLHVHTQTVVQEHNCKQKSKDRRAAIGHKW